MKINLSEQTEKSAEFLRTRRKSFVWAWRGLVYAFKTQPNIWIHAVATLLVVSLSFWLKISRLEWIGIVLAVGLVWIAELMNTVAETIVNISSPDKHPLARIAKDLAAAAVLVTAVVALIVGLIIFGPLLLTKLSLAI
ncbi:MAG: diacylglycerol kinase family protein [Anaerolineaceae bacterium]|nr:diacylglycerol kinase family protein [Anaerolineaceae bacterium]